MRLLLFDIAFASITFTLLLAGIMLIPAFFLVLKDNENSNKYIQRHDDVL